MNAARAEELADAFENYDPKPGDQDAPLPPIMAVKLAAWRRDTAERELAEAVRAAREQRLSWREVGEALGHHLEDALEGIEDVRVFSTLTRIGASGARRASVLVLTDRVRVLDNGDEDPAGLPADALLPVSDVSGTSLREILGALLPEAPDAAQAEDGDGTADGR